MSCGWACRRRCHLLCPEQRTGNVTWRPPGRCIGERELRKTFRAPRNGGEVRALDGVSIEVAPGELTALVGPDGAGKTTLIRLIAGLLTADAGELRVLGIDVGRAIRSASRTASATCRRGSACTRT